MVFSSLLLRLCANAIFFLAEYLLWDFTLFCLNCRKGFCLPKRNFFGFHYFAVTSLTFWQRWCQRWRRRHRVFCYSLENLMCNSIIWIAFAIYLVSTCAAKWLCAMCVRVNLVECHKQERRRRRAGGHWTSICWDLKSKALVPLRRKKKKFQKCNAMRVNKCEMNASRISVRQIYGLNLSWYSMTHTQYDLNDA